MGYDPLSGIVTRQSGSQAFTQTLNLYGSPATNSRGSQSLNLYGSPDQNSRSSSSSSNMGSVSRGEHAGSFDVARWRQGEEKSMEEYRQYRSGERGDPVIVTNNDFQVYSGGSFVPPVPALPPPPPPPTTIKIKSATPEIILWDDSLIPTEILSDLIFEDIGGQELLSVVRHDTINGDNVSKQLIKNLTFLNQEYSSKKILSLQNTSDRYFSNFSIKLESKIPFEGNGPLGSNIYVDPVTQDIIIELVNLEIDEQLEAQISVNGTIYTITLGVIES